VRVTVQAALGDTVASLVTGAIRTPSSDTLPTKHLPVSKSRSLQVPDDQGLVARSGQEHVGVLEGRGEGLYFISASAYTLLTTSSSSPIVELTVTQPLCPEYHQRNTLAPRSLHRASRISLRLKLCEFRSPSRVPRSDISDPAAKVSPSPLLQFPTARHGRTHG
jgi:hypothetical protein